MRNKARILRVFIFSLALSGATWAQQSTGLIVDPGTFDFGWAPANAKVNARFQVRNESAAPIPIIDVEPSCGCTAPDFTPGAVSSMEAMSIGLAFDTRGYDGRRFYKKTRVKAETVGDEEIWVNLRGHVTDPNAQLHPTGTGVAAFAPSSRSRKETIELKNESGEPLALTVVQPSEAWATVTVPDRIAAGGTADVVIQVDGGTDPGRHTSVTLEGRGSSKKYRVTLAVRTGDAAGGTPRIQPPAAENTR